MTDPAINGAHVNGASVAECPNRPEWAMPGVAAIVGDGFCVHCSKVKGEWVECEGGNDAP